MKSILSIASKMHRYNHTPQRLPSELPMSLVDINILQLNVKQELTWGTSVVSPHKIRWDDLEASSSS